MTPPPEPPDIVGAVYDASLGRVTVSASEPVTVVDDSTTPWTITVNDVGQPVGSVNQFGPDVVLGLSMGLSGDMRLSYAGGAFVQGDASGLFLEPVTELPVS